MKKIKHCGIFLLSRLSLSIFLGIFCFLYLFAASTAWTLPGESDSSQSPSSPDEVDAFQVQPPPGEAEPARLPSSDKKKDIVDSIHDTVTSTFLASANWVDSFFNDERVVQEENQSTLRVYTELFKQEGSPADFNLKVRLKMSLPRARDRLSLLVSADGDDEVNPDNSPGESLTQRFEGRDADNVSTSLWYSFFDNEKRNLSLSLGFRLSGGSLVAYAGPRYRQFHKFKLWDMRFIERLRYYSDNGWESRTTVDFERSVFENCLFIATFDGTWLEGIPGYFYNVEFVLYQPLKNHRALQYELVNSIHTRPNHRLDLTTFRIRYRQKIWKEWFYFEVGPQVSFPRDRDFELTPGIYLRLEAIFGKTRDLFSSLGIGEDERFH